MADAFASERKAYRAHIRHLEGEVNHLRMLLNNALGISQADGPPLDHAMGAFDAPSEDEEDIKEMLEQGLIGHDEAREMLAAAGALNTDVELTLG